MRRRSVTIDGVDHRFIVVPASSPDAPAVLFTHGGPGSPIVPLAHARDLDLSDVVTLVFWDQRGAGMSARGVDVETLTVARLVADTNAMAEHVTDLLDIDRVVMLGHSWGSYLGVLAVAGRPELYRAYVGVAQMNDPAAAARESLRLYRQRAEDRGDTSSVVSLDALAQEELTESRAWASAQERQARLTGTSFLREGYPRRALLRDIARCRPYSWGQAHAFHDQLQAPTKTWTAFTDSAHAPFIDSAAAPRRVVTTVGAAVRGRDPGRPAGAAPRSPATAGR